MKKSLVVGVVMAFSLGALPVSAASNPHVTPVKSQQEKINDMMADGLSYEDASYYAKVDDMVKQLESKHQVIDLSQAPEISDEYARTHQSELRDRVLKMDKAALKKMFTGQAKMIENSQNDIEKMVKEDKKQGTVKNHYEVKYPDGSVVTVKTSVKPADDTKDTSVTTNTNMSGPWNKDGLDSTSYNPYEGKWTATEDWTCNSGVNYSKVRAQLTYNLNKNGFTSGAPYDYNYWTVNAMSVNGAASSYGVVSIDTEANVVGNNYNSATGSEWIQGYHDVRFKVSGSFSGSYDGVSISVSAGGQWHQYAIVEAQGAGYLDFWAARYL